MREFVITALMIAGAGLAHAPRPSELVPGDHAGFEAIFDGLTLKGWDGDPAYWRVENGAIVGESTPGRRLTQNTFLIWRGGTPADFELKCDYGSPPPTAACRSAACSCRPAATSASG